MSNARSTGHRPAHHRSVAARLSRSFPRALKSTLHTHPRLDKGLWWAQLGGFYMNVHKLLENTLFECELYLGYALTFGDLEVRYRAERNLRGCYQKRLLEAARFMWMDAVKQMMRSEWLEAAETLSAAASKYDGWGWAVNCGDIWITEAAARLLRGAELASRAGPQDTEAAQCIGEAEALLVRGIERAHESSHFLPEGHPWANELGAALRAYHELCEGGSDTTDWIESFKARTLYWCSLVLGGSPPFPPRPRPRLEAAAALIQRLPGFNE